MENTYIKKLGELGYSGDISLQGLIGFLGDDLLEIKKILDNSDCYYYGFEAKLRNIDCIFHGYTFNGVICECVIYKLSTINIS